MHADNAYYITKICKLCNRHRLLSEFGRQAAAKDGLQSSCRECTNAVAKAKYDADPEFKERKLAASNKWKGKNVEQTREYARDYSKTAWHDNPEKMREKERQRAIANPGRTSKQSREWERRNPEKAKQAHKKWKLANQDKIRAAERRRYAENPVKSAIKSHGRRTRMADGGTFTTDEVSAIRKMQKDKCAICRIPLRGNGHIDHIIALANGGLNNRRNLQILCPSCNGKKSAKDPIDYMRSLGRLL